MKKGIELKKENEMDKIINKKKRMTNNTEQSEKRYHCFNANETRKDKMKIILFFKKMNKINVTNIFYYYYYYYFHYKAEIIQKFKTMSNEQLLSAKGVCKNLFFLKK
ncbi:hypothetical protein RFI_37376 [Reticulomyxa filosa]|uniref:Uncharacterized protein n=1 Tax=Reticulomyxa filosa TaxID=46433 RepID=X6LDK3_RETFI|nr:hypothetical protein RFI_37376 [Reticulomyxa filosa]|eukprot:ETO00083.1 hypothetical protein RFI_37376 [Reticulomyxa filosa]